MSNKQFEDFYPLSPMQQGMLFHSLYAPETGVYVGQLSCEIVGDLDIGGFERAWQRVVDRYAILRTTFVSGDIKEPVQVVHRRVAVPLECQDWRDLSVDEQGARFQEFLQDDQRRGFKLTTPPLLRLSLFRTAEQSYRLVWTYHHLLFDGWSLPLLLREVLAFYAAFQRGSDLSLPPPRPFRSYIAWLRKQDMAQAEAFWRRSLAGFTAPTPLMVDLPPDPASAEAGAVCERERLLPAATTAALQGLARQRQLTLNTLVQGAWALLLSRYSGEEDVLFGATVSGRPADLPGADAMVGLFINTLPVRVQVAPQAILGDWLKALQLQQAELRQYEYSSLIQIQGWSAAPRGLPLFESILVFENFPVAAAMQDQGETGNLAIRAVNDDQRTNFPLSLVAYPGERMLLRIAYDRQRFTAETIKRMLGHLQTLLEGFCTGLDQTLSNLSLLSEAERQQIAAWNDTAAPFPTDRCFPDRFAEQAARTPDATALVYAGTTLSYRELNARANQLAHYLRRLGVGPESIIGLCLEPSLDMVIAVLGVLKAGGAFLPLDPAYPAERLAFMLEDSQPIVLLTLERLHPSAGLRTGVSRLAGWQVETCQPANLQTCNLDTDWHLIAQEPESDPECSATPENLAYVIYTSGSTGRPKGTLLQYRGLSNFANVVIETFGITAASRVLQFASFSFDAAISELVVLLAGATLVLDRRETLTSPPDLIELLREQAISVVTLPPSLLALLPPDDLPDLQTVVSAGESCPWEVAERWRHGRRFLNGYGPTEATVGVAYYRVTGRVPGTISVPIGTPVANAQIYLLDRQGRLAPVGVPGELHIGGVGLARGYLNRPELTAERFITLPDVPTLQRSNVSTFQRLYKTGDLARYLPDGTIEFLGRIDQQVKIRGFRVELGEIEATVGSHPAVQTAAVVAQTDAAGLQRLVAYVVPRAEARIVGEGVDLNAGAPSVDLARVMRSFLQERLPDYMLPAAFVPLDALPLTPSGKVDRKALAARESGHFELEPDYVAPRTPEEEILAGIWASVFGAPQVGVNANFFELGGHSLLATQVVARLRDLMQVDVPLRSLFERPTLAEFAQAVAAARRMAQGMPAPPLRPAPRDGALPLSFAQQRLWFLDQLEPGGAFYNIPVAVRLSGVLDAAALERALNEVVRRHDILRTSIVTVAGQPQQVIAPADAAESRLTLMLIDRRDLPVADRDAEVLRLAAAEAQRPFDLARGPLLRTSLIQLDETEYAGLFVMHHIISDGWSMGVFVRELVACYVAGVNDQPASLPALPIQYADFAVWQRDWLGGKNVQPDATAHAETEERPGSPLQRQLDYWKQQLAGAPPLLELPTDRPRPALQSFRGASLVFELPKEQTEQLRALSRREGATLFMTLLAAFQVLLARYSGQEDICVGTPIANRNRPEIEGLIGFFVNTLVLRSDISGAPDFRALLKQVRTTALDAYAHQDVPFEMVVDAIQPERNMSYSPLFQVMFVLQNAPVSAQELPGLRVSSLDAHSGSAKFDLTLEMMEGPDGLAGSFEYNTDLFDAATIARLAAHFQRLLASIVAAPDQAVAALPLLREAERAQLLFAWNPPAQTFPATPCLHERFAAQAARTPDAVAVVCDDARLTYAELNARANQLAHYLRAHGVGPEQLVALYLDRLIELIVAILGVLKAGGAYLPIDLVYPPERIAFMLEDAQPTALVTLERWNVGTLERWNVPTLSLDADWPAIAQQPATDPDSAATPDTAAYVIYTSGSTGQPKGVLVTHANVMRLFTATDAWYQFDQRDVWTLFHSYAFDFSVWEIWGALLYGGRLVVVPQWVSRSPAAFYELLVREQVTVLNQTPAAFRQFQQVALRADAGADLALRLVIFGGEALEFQSLRPWLERYGDARPQLVNMYGITETTVHVTCRPIRMADLDAGRGSVIGQPIPDLQVYVLDGQGEPAPLGVAGELYVGGAGVARGYLNRPELTEARFRPDRFAQEKNGNGAAAAKLYRTGDRARRLANGDLEYLGRIDQQVKIRGFRIELGEIEAALNAHARVRASAVLVREDTPGTKRLVAYVVLHPADETGEAAEAPSVALRQWLQPKLPDYMLPAAYVVVDQLPLTANGKLDRTALPAPDGERLAAEHSYVAPRSPAEKTLAEIWSRILGVDKIGVFDNFFATGGDSILSIQVIAHANQAGIRLSPRQFFQHPTIAELVAAAAQNEAQPVLTELAAGPIPLTPIQRWFFDQHPEQPQHWNTSILLEVPPGLDPQLLERATHYLQSYHDALRLRFTVAETGWQQTTAFDPVPSPFCLIDLSETPKRKLAQAISDQAVALQQSLDLAAGPLFRVAHFDLGSRRNGRVMIVFHHLVVDGVSLRIFIGDLLTVYRQLDQGEAPALPPKTTPFQTWAAQMEAYAQTAALRQELDYWLDLSRQTVPALPVDFAGGTNNYGDAMRLVAGLNVQETQALLREVPAAYGSQINEVLLTALVRAFARWTGEQRLLIELDSHGREDVLEGVDVSRTVGWCTSIYPVLLDLAATDDPVAALQEAQVHLRLLPQRGIGYGLLRYACRDEAIRSALSQMPPPEVNFNYLGQFDQPVGAPPAPTPEAAAGANGTADVVPFRVAGESVGPEQYPHGRRSALLYIVGVVAGGKLNFQWSYSAKLYKKSTVERLAKNYLKELRHLIAHSRSVESDRF